MFKGKFDYLQPGTPYKCSVSMSILLTYKSTVTSHSMSHTVSRKTNQLSLRSRYSERIRRAADILGINASVISLQIALLERSLQLPLLERKGRSVVLTEAGKLLADDFFESLNVAKPSSAI